MAASREYPGNGSTLGHPLEVYLYQGQASLVAQQ